MHVVTPRSAVQWLEVETTFTCQFPIQRLPETSAGGPNVVHRSPAEGSRADPCVSSCQAFSGPARGTYMPLWSVSTQFSWLHAESMLSCHTRTHTHSHTHSAVMENPSQGGKRPFFRSHRQLVSRACSCVPRSSPVRSRANPGGAVRERGGAPRSCELIAWIRKRHLGTPTHLAST